MRNPFRRSVLGPGKTVLAITGVLAAAIVGFALFLGPTAVNGIPGISYYNVSVQFTNADTISLHDHVRIAGVDVGQVSGTTVQNGMAMVKLQLDSSVKPLRQGTIVQIRPQSAVGTRFVELDPSKTGTPIPDGGTIAARYTRVEIPLDQVLDTFQPKVRARAQQLLQELGTGFAGRGQDVGTALATFPTDFTYLQNVSAAIDNRGGLGPFVAAAQGAANAADPVREDIALGFSPEARTLQAFADHPVPVEALVSDFPPALISIRTGLANSTPLLRRIDSFAIAARPALSTARGALEQTTLLLNEGRPGLRAAPAVLQLIKPATPATLNLLNTLTPVLGDVDTALTAATGPVTSLGARDCDLKYWTSNWASALSWGDSYSNYLRFDLVGSDPTSVGGLGSSSNAYVHTDADPAPCQAEKDKAP